MAQTVQPFDETVIPPHYDKEAPNVKMNLRSSRVYSAPTPKMPPGLVELMEGLARDVLKNNPPEVYAFCADHMFKLLQIRDGSTTKKPTLDQKIATAIQKINDRATHRRNELDKQIQMFVNDKAYNNELIKENNTKADQYIQSNIIKIPQNHLTSNIEHEIISGLTKEKSFSSEPANVTDANINIIAGLPDNELEYNCHPKNDSPDIPDKIKLFDHHNDIKERENESADRNLCNETIDTTDTTEKGYNSQCEKIISEEKLSDENILRRPDNSKDKHFADLNASSSDNIDDSVNIPVGENTSNNTQENVLKNNTFNIMSSECQEIHNNTPNNVDTSNFKTAIAEHDVHQNDHDSTNAQKHIEIDNQQGDEKDIETEIRFKGSNSNIIEETREGDKLIFPDNNIVIGESIDIKNNPDDENNQINSLDNIDKYNDLREHIHNNSMDLETAAITIQKVFRSFLFRNKTLSVDDSTNIDINLLVDDKEQKVNGNMSNNIVNKDRRPLGVNRMDTVLQTVNEEKSLSLSTDDSSTLSSAATIIQAHVRGFLVRNNANLNNTTSSTSGIDSDGMSTTSLEGDTDYRKNKTVLNIHIVPEGSHFMSRDESLLTSMDLSLDGSPRSSTNLHPLGYDKSERRKQLKREDAIQSVSPPSCHSGKLSDDVDSVKEIIMEIGNDNLKCEPKINSDINLSDTNIVTSSNALNDDNIATMIDKINTQNSDNVQIDDHTNNIPNQLSSLSQMTSDEMDVVTPLDDTNSEIVENNTKLIHSGECHDVVLPTNVSRNETSVVREFQNVLVYFLLWNNK